MKKSELIQEVSARTGLGKREAARAVDAILASVEEALRRGGDVTVSGFGKFHVSERGARYGVNPRTGERIQIAASRVPRFAPGAKLRLATAELPGEPIEPWPPPKKGRSQKKRSV